MIKYLLKATNEYYVDTKEDADTLHQQIEEEASANGWTLSGWSETFKTKKQGGEIVESWYVCKSVVTFNDAKEPEIPLRSIAYNMMDYVPPAEETLPWEEQQSAF